MTKNKEALEAIDVVKSAWPDEVTVMLSHEQRETIREALTNAPEMVTVEGIAQSFIDINTRDHGNMTEQYISSECAYRCAQFIEKQFINGLKIVREK